MAVNGKPPEVVVAFVGSGGTGVMTAGELLLSTAASCGLYGVLTKSFGPQIRGGESACFVRLGSAPFQKQADEIDLVVAFDWRNVDRFQEELRLRSGAWILFDPSEGAPPASWEASTPRSIPIQWKDLVGRLEGGKGPPNIFVLGLLCWLLGLSEKAALAAVGARLVGRGPGPESAEPADPSRLFQAGWHWAEQQWGAPAFPLPTKLDGVSRWVLTGNQGIVLGSLLAGCEFYASYPITPATDIMEELSHYLPPRGGLVMQAEDELAAINMAIGASFAGKKAMTGTSGPGFSLMAEGLGLAVMAEIPLVVVDVQRVGPSTGIATKTEQSDLWAAIGSSHGDNPRVVLAPSSIRTCIETTVQAFNIAETYQVPVILLSDQFLGGRTEILDRCPLHALPVHGRHLAPEPGTALYRRFQPSEGAVAPITVPGQAGGEYVAEGTEHDARGRPTSSAATHQLQSERRKKKLETLALQEGWLEECGDPTARVGLIGWGSTGGVVREAVQAARAAGVAVKGIIPHLLFPPQPEAMQRVFEGLDVLYVAELSSMAQFYHYLRAFYRLPPSAVPIGRAGGMPLRTSEVLDALRSTST